MNGLEYIRKRCNISETQLAEQLHVSRQAVNMWENGKKPVPAKRRTQLATFFGIDERFFGEITEEDKEFILGKAMFKHKINGKEAYSYVPGEEEDLVLHFFEEKDMSLDEEYALAVKRREEVLERTNRFICGGEIDFLFDKVVQINNGCNRVNLMLNFLEMPLSKKRHLKVPFRYEMINIVKAMQVAYGYMSLEDYMCDLMEVEHLPQDIEFFTSLIDLFKNHWETEESRIDEEYQEARRKRQNNKSEKELRTLEERVEEAENEIRAKRKKGENRTTFMMWK